MPALRPGPVGQERSMTPVGRAGHRRRPRADRRPRPIAGRGRGGDPGRQAQRVVLPADVAAGAVDWRRRSPRWRTWPRGCGPGRCNRGRSPCSGRASRSCGWSWPTFSGWLGLYVLTNRRVLRVSGAVREAVQQCLLRYIARAEVSVSPAERLLGVGSLSFESSDPAARQAHWAPHQPSGRGPADRPGGHRPSSLSRWRAAPGDSPGYRWTARSATAGLARSA